MKLMAGIFYFLILPALILAIVFNYNIPLVSTVAIIFWLFGFFYYYKYAPISFDQDVNYPPRWLLSSIWFVVIVLEFQLKNSNPED